MTNEQNIIAVPVPVDATDIGLNIPYNNHVYYSLPDDDEDGFQERKFVRCPEIIPNSAIPYKFLGCVSFKDGAYDIPFDPEPFVESVLRKVDGFENPIHVGYKDYSINANGIAVFRLSEHSFISLLQSMGHYWPNPLGEEPEYSEYVPAYLNDNFNKRNKIDDYEKDLEAWRAAQEKCLRPAQKLAVMKIGG